MQNQIISDNAIDLIKRLLVKNPDQRLGSGQKEELSFNMLKKHKYFQGINIDKIYQIIPPDIDVKSFKMDTEEQLNERLREFQKNARQDLDKLMKQQKQQQKQSNISIIIQGIVQHRYKYPYYEYVYLRIYSTHYAYILSLQNYKKSIQKFEILDCNLLYDNFINNNKKEQQTELIPQISLFKTIQKKQQIKKDQEIKINEEIKDNNIEKKYVNKFWIKRQGTWNNPFVKEVFKVQNAEEWVNKINQIQIYYYYK